MSQTVTVSLERQGRTFDLDTECMALGKCHVDLDALPDWSCEAEDGQEENGLRYRFCTYRKTK